ncbi:hypothetical protein K469DRAFT_729651 [Zopfia rhizophila CBS 207.26]|uniref:Zn(2)-C6 fungal-type domain-containing protein n=1 Tax=Zopfia rhizophila CBS 207.26 TaxID=1314779 RepID=A0A6A6DMC6_9PEZI|nr:hypothetical protein K469DRAFT_729651 [Zopfia rhizophila CBS 207.26]
MDDELDLRYHKGPKPEVYYRWPALESLGSQSLIPVELVTVFVFVAGSSATVPSSQQLNLGFPRIKTGRISTDSPCRACIVPRPRRKGQIEDSESDCSMFIETIQGLMDSNTQSAKPGAKTVVMALGSNMYAWILSRTRRRSWRRRHLTPKIFLLASTYDRGGAVHIKFLTKREAINVLYKHNSVHRDIATRPTNGQIGNSNARWNVASEKKRRRKVQAEESNRFETVEYCTLVSPETSSTPGTKKRKKGSISASPEATRTSSIKEQRKTKCREKKLKCDEAKPFCNYCSRASEACQYEEKVVRKRSRTSCMNCR